MKTLHTCHWQSLSHFKQYLNILAEGDSLIVYSESGISPTLWQQITEGITIPVYLVKSTNHPHNCDHSIDHLKWLELITKHDNTFAWK